MFRPKSAKYEWFIKLVLGTESVTSPYVYQYMREYFAVSRCTNRECRNPVVASIEAIIHIATSDLRKSYSFAHDDHCIYKVATTRLSE